MVPFKAAGLVLLVGVLLLAIKYGLNFVNKNRRH
jgi:hypothetical protein